MSYVVVGAGGVGKSLMFDVWRDEPDARFLAIDPSVATLADLKTRAEGKNLECLNLDASNVSDLANAIAGASVVANCTDGARSLDILDAAIAAGVNYVDVHGTLLVNERFERSEAAKNAGITALIGMGCSPGITNMLGAYGARQMSGEISIDVEYYTRRQLNPSWGLLETALRQFRDHARSPVYENGKITEHKPFEGTKVTSFPSIDDPVELVYTPHSEPYTIPRFVPGLKRVTVRGSYSAEMMALLKSLYRFGLLDPERSVSVDGKQVDFQPLLREALFAGGEARVGETDPRYILRVIVTAEEEGRFMQSETTLGHDAGWHPLPQANLTALPTAYSVRLLGSGRFRSPGVCGPELFAPEDVEGCLSHLKSRGVWVHTVRKEWNKT